MLVLLTCVVAATVVLAPLATRVLGRNAGWVLALPLLGAAGIGAGAYQPGSMGQPHEESYDWIPQLGVSLSLRLDGLSLVFLMLVLIIGAGVMVYSTRYLHGSRSHSWFYMLIAAFAFAMTLLVLADDLVVFYIAWELTTLCSFFLIGATGEKGYESAIRTLLVTVFGGLMLLTALVIAVSTTQTTRISEIIASPAWQEHPQLLVTVAILIAIAAGTKSAQFPFQSWLPDSMVAIAPVSAYLHAAAMVKAGIYLVLRFSPMVEGVMIWHLLLVSAGAITALFGAITAVKQTDLKALLAYSTMSQLGLLIMTVGVGTQLALTSAIVHTVAHACFKAALFMSVGIVEHETGTREYPELIQRRLRMPITQTGVVISAASMAGIPFFFGFVSKEMLLTGALSSEFNPTVSTMVVGIVVLTSMFTFAYSARYVLGVLGKRGGTDEEPVTGEASPAFYLVPAMLSLISIALGLAPQLLEPIIADAAFPVTGDHTDPHLALWHGLTIELGLSALIIIVGLLLVWRRWAVQVVLHSFIAPVKGIDAVDAIRYGIINFGAKYFTGPTGTTSQRRHLAAPLAGLVVIAAVGIFTIGELPPSIGHVYFAADWALLAIAVIGVVASVQARSRMTLAIVVSIVGFGVTLWFFNLGAADVATTQLTVEILTVVVIVMVLHRLPDRFPRESRSSVVSSIILAAAVGIASTLAVWGLTGRREKSPAAEFYLREGANITGGDNIVNTILVEFRAFDTLGELTVLGVAGLTVAVLLRSRPMRPRAHARLNTFSPVYDAQNNSIFLRTAARLILPIIVVTSVVLFFRGHNATGGGFVAALVGAAGFSLAYLMAPSDEKAKVRWPYMLLIGVGIATGAATGLLGYFEGSYLTPLSTHILGIHLTTSLIFDLGVYLAVLGVILASINLAGIPRRGDTSHPDDGQPEAGPRDVGMLIDGRLEAIPARKGEHR